MGRPVVAARAGGLPEVVVDGETGVLVAPQNSDAVADAISFLLARPDIAEQLGANARGRAAALFSQERHVEDYDHQYRLLARREAA